MRFTSTFVSLLSAVLLVQADNCPAVWNQISSLLHQSFVDPATGQCNDNARAAIRFGFHDAGTFSTKVPCNGSPACGGADASLMLVAGEIDRPENGGLQDYFNFINAFYTDPAHNFNQQVTAADLVFFAANVGVVSCPLGPVVKTVVGRQSESTIPSPTNLMPAGFGAGSDATTLVNLFADKGFSDEDLAALVGAHTCSRAFAQPQVPFGNSQDDTPGIWDVDFYSNTINPPNNPNVTRFQSDISLSQSTADVGKQFRGFVNNQGKWSGKFADAMYRLSILGINPSVSKNFIDCTNALPKQSGKRSLMSMPRNNRAR